MKKIGLIMCLIMMASVIFAQERYLHGDRGPGGGMVFYYSEVGFEVYDERGKSTLCHYLEVSHVLGNPVSWCPQKPGKKCCDPKTEATIGYGKLNTARILAAKHCCGKADKFNCAAALCAEYATSTTKPGDWWLPSKDELDFIYTNLAQNKLFPQTKWYWSSTAYNKENAWMQDFEYGYQLYESWSTKNKKGYVLAIRAF